MPRLVVLVQKDDNGRLWDFVFPQQDWASSCNCFGNASLLIHKADYPETVPQHAQAAPAQEDSVTVGVLAPEEAPELSKRRPRPRYRRPHKTRP